jgi:hypothetical protein
MSLPIGRPAEAETTRSAMTKSWSRILLPPALCVAVLAGMTVEGSRRTTADTANPYHDRARAAVEAIPWMINGWSGKDEKLPTEAVKLLKPNAVMSRRYTDAGSAGFARTRDRWAIVLVVQCRESRDMVGHYPHNCYPSSGWIEERAVRFDGSVDGVTIPATEYHFTRTKQGQTDRWCVYNFLIVPGVGIVPNIEGVERAAEDYQQRYFGAAQYQVVLSADLPREEREDIYRTMIRANLPAIEALKTVNTGDVQ